VPALLVLPMLLVELLVLPGLLYVLPLVELLGVPYALLVPAELLGVP
jgi:hypothetical protein